MCAYAICGACSWSTDLDLLLHISLDSHKAKLEMKKAWKAKKRAEAAQRRREKKAEQGGSWCGSVTLFGNLSAWRTYGPSLLLAVARMKDRLATKRKHALLSGLELLMQFVKSAMVGCVLRSVGVSVK